MDHEMSDAVNVFQAPGGSRRRKFASELGDDCASVFQQAAKRQHLCNERVASEALSFQSGRMPLEDITCESQTNVVSVPATRPVLSTYSAVDMLQSHYPSNHSAGCSTQPCSRFNPVTQALSSGGGKRVSHRAEPVFGMSEQSFLFDNSSLPRSCSPDKQSVDEAYISADCQLTHDELRQFEAARRATLSAEPGTSSAPVKMRFLSMLADWNSVRKMYNVAPGSQKVCEHNMLNHVMLQFKIGRFSNI